MLDNLGSLDMIIRRTRAVTLVRKKYDSMVTKEQMVNTVRTIAGEAEIRETESLCIYRTGRLQSPRWKKKSQRLLA